MKICSCCDKKKQLNDFPKCKGRNGSYYFRGKCKVCTNKAGVKRIFTDPLQKERKSKYDRQWRKDNPDKVIAFKEKQTNNLRIAYEKRRNKLTDGYILACMCLKKSDNVPAELVEAKRLQIKISRLIGELGHEKRSRIAGRFS